MKRNELKQILKPLIKECIKECIFEEGVEKIRRLNESAKFSNVNVFEGTTPIVESAAGSPMAGTHSEDAGVDISSFGNAKWKEIMRRSS